MISDALAQSDAEPVADIDLAIDKVLMFRLERMDDGIIWIRLYRENGDDKVIWLHSSSAISAIIEEDKDEPLAQSDAEPRNDMWQKSAELAARDNASLRRAGTGLAEAALRVIRKYDGTHRLALAVGEWAKSVANEGGRGGQSDASAGLIEAAEWHEAQEPDELPAEPVGKTHVGKAAAPPKPEPDPDALLAARKRGMEARRRGMPRSATPKEFKADAELLGSWLEGYTVAAQQIADDEAERDRLGGL